MLTFVENFVVHFVELGPVLYDQVDDNYCFTNLLHILTSVLHIHFYFLAGCTHENSSCARQIRGFMKKAPSHPFLLGALALLALFAGCSSKPTPSATEPGTPTPIAEELKPLQGYWEGDGAGGKCSITITGNSLYYRNSSSMYKATFTLPAGTDPHQLQATIKDVSPPSSNAIGRVVFAIFKIEDGTLTLAEDDMSDKPPKTFASASSRYNLKKVQPQRKNIQIGP